MAAATAATDGREREGKTTRGDSGRRNDDAGFGGSGTGVWRGAGVVGVETESGAEDGAAFGVGIDGGWILEVEVVGSCTLLVPHANGRPLAARCGDVVADVDTTMGGDMENCPFLRRTTENVPSKLSLR